MSTTRISAGLPPEAVASPGAFQAADLEARRLLSDLHTPRPAIFWTDLMLSAAVGWGAFAACVASRSFSWPAIAAGVVAAFALYRCMCFVHEISHLRQAALRGFETTWNLIAGAPMLMPSFVYAGMHQNHHKLSTYGTNQDPEYLPFWGRPLMIAFFLLESLLLPVLLVVRFVLLAPFSLAFVPVRRWLAARASSLAINPRYRREVSAALLSKMARWEAVSLALWSVLLASAAFGKLPWRFFALWYVVTASASLVNTIRTLGAHRYASDGRPIEREGQLADSIDTPGAFWTELWAPVGLRYHALHHYFPGVPYHNLKAAYQRLIQALPQEARYRQSTSSSLPHSLDELWRGDREPV